MKVRFYETAAGRSPVEVFLSDCSQDIRGDFYDAVELLKRGQILSMPLSRNLSSIYPGLHELRLKDRYGIFRFFYFIKKGEAIYMVHSFSKKTREIPQREIELILKRLREV